MLACKTVKTTVPPENEVAAPREATVITQKTYNLVLRSYASPERAEVYKEQNITLIIDLNERTFSGNTGCNSFNGKALLQTEDQVVFKKFAVTEMLCGKDTMEVEARYLNALSSETFNILEAEGKIIFTSVDGKTKLVFEERAVNIEK